MCHCSIVWDASTRMTVANEGFFSGFFVAGSLKMYCNYTLVVTMYGILHGVLHTIPRFFLMVLSYTLFR